MRGDPNDPLTGGISTWPDIHLRQIFAGPFLITMVTDRAFFAARVYHCLSAFSRVSPRENRPIVALQPPIYLS